MWTFDHYATTPQNVTVHLSAIYEEGELAPEATCKEFLQVRQEGARQVRRSLTHYNLAAVLAVGYRVCSPRGAQFRQWATARLEEYVVKGFAMDDERLKQHDAAEVIARRADAAQPNMGLTTWAGAGTGGRVKRADVGVAKNYLNRDEIETLNLIVSAYLDFAELQARNRKPMAMKDWIGKLDEFLRISERELLTHAGTVTHDAAVAKALLEYDKYRAIEDRKPQPVDAHFEEAVRKAKRLTGSSPKKQS